jgi:streptogramin lyase
MYGRLAVLVAIAGALTWAGTAEAAHVTLFSNGITQGSTIRAIALGPDGKLWFTAGDRIGRFNPADGQVDYFSAGITPSALPNGITLGPDGNLWFTELNRPGIARITPSGAIEELPPLTAGSNPQDITAGPDGKLWYTNDSGAAIGRVDPITRQINEFPVTPGSGPERITAGPDGNLWFTESEGHRIAKITPLGVVTEFPPGPLASKISLGEITTGPDGNLWFLETESNAIGRFTTTGALTEFSGFTPGNPEGPEAIAAAPDGNLWFTEGDKGDSVGRISVDGAFTEFKHGLPVNTWPGDWLVVGPDGNLWFSTEQSGPGGIDSVARLSLDTPPRVSTGDATNIAATGATLPGTVNPVGDATTWSVQYGTTDAYGSVTPGSSLPAGGQAIPVSSAVTDLAPATTYHYRVVATNGSGTTNGPDKSFTTTAAPPPLVTPAPACTLKAKSATVPKTGVLSFTALCDQAANVSLTGTIADTVNKKAKAAVVKSIPLAVVTGAAQAKVPVTLKVKLPKRALAGLKRGDKESAKFKLTATNRNGTSTATTTLKRLKQVKPKKPRH